MSSGRILLAAAQSCKLPFEMIFVQGLIFQGDLPTSIGAVRKPAETVCGARHLKEFHGDLPTGSEGSRENYEYLQKANRKEARTVGPQSLTFQGDLPPRSEESLGKNRSTASGRLQQKT